MEAPTLMRRLVGSLLLVLALAVPAAAQQASYYNPRQIERDVAPIALYPDQLLTQILMAATYPLLRGLGFCFDLTRFPRLIPAQLACFGLGQIVFALGFGWAGLNGAGRKAYGTEQHVRSASEHAGLIVMGIGGVIAVAGGLLFLGLVIRAWLGRRTDRACPVSLSLQPVE